MIKLDALTKGEMGLERRGGGGSEEARNTKKAVLCVSAYMCDNKRERERANSNKTKDRKDQKKTTKVGKKKKKKTPEQKRIKESQIQFIVCESKRGRCGSKHPHQSQTAAAPKRSRCLPTWFWLGSDQ